ncbi:MAG TPA: ATPase, T2SS/T4P/T4SS family [Burkholderiales bacterium]|nr:ATPase, T2SS/T4P/T4SS family [Burkholderiales bacterium]
MSHNITWPTPPGFRLATEAQAAASLACVAMRTDGRTVSGSLELLDPEKAVAVLVSLTDKRPLSLAFSELKSLNLIAPVELVEEPTVLDPDSGEFFTSAASQDFEVEYLDGEKFTGPTRGYYKTDFGLFLFRLTQTGGVTRCFVPTVTIKTWRIGPKIGDILVAERVATAEQIEQALKRQQELRAKRLGEFLRADEIVTPEDLGAALERQKAMPMKRLGEVLLAMGLITQEQLNKALAQQKKQPSTPLGQILMQFTEERISEALDQQHRQRATPLGQILVEMGIVDESTLKDVLARKLGIPVVSLARFKIDPNAVRMVDPGFARAHCLIPIQCSADGLVVAAEDPLDQATFERLRFLTQQQILPVIANRAEIEAALDTCHGAQPAAQAVPRRGAEQASIKDLAGQLAAEREPEERVEDVAPTDNVMVRLVNKMIEEAYAQNVSDIHVEAEPGRGATRIRFRKDGTLMPYLEVPANFRSALITRIKVMADLDISVHRKPQDGKINFHKFGGAPVELRVVTVPTAGGMEDLVMRLLTAARPLPLEQLGMNAAVLERLQALVYRPHGLLLVCGPTGSGKTTTLHSVLALINRPGIKIWTAEDPIEIVQPGLRQIQIQAATGWTFAAALRTLFRADPDVIMLGEMRDVETARTAIEASLTGHLVLSTLHTNSAPESVARLLDLGMDPFNFSDALLGVLAQRLARKLCETCKTPYTPSEEELASLAAEYCLGSNLDPGAVLRGWRAATGNRAPTLYRVAGCESCSRLGYAGRIGLHELLAGTPAIRRLIQGRAPAEPIAIQGMADGMRTLKQDGIEKILSGLTDISQVRAVCG